jgi:oxaloacetate decarboxylase alpha subunit
MVTPFPQMVLAQALANVLGSERYGQVPDEVTRYVMGRFGRPTAPVDREVEAKILDRPRAKEIAAEPPCLTLDDARRKIGTKYSDEEFLLRAVMPAEQVDAMKAAGPAARGYNPIVRKVARAIGELPRNSDPPSDVIDKPGLKLKLKRTHRAGATANA